MATREYKNDGQQYRVDPVNGGVRPEVVLTDETGADASPAGAAQLPTSLGPKTGAGSLSVVPATDAAFVPGAGEAHMGQVGGTTIAASDTFARVADANAYTAGDAIGATVSDSGTTALRSLAVGRVAAGSGYLTKFRLWTDQVANVARHRIHFFTVAAPADVIPGDNVPMTLRWNNRAQRIGYVDMPAMSTETNSGGSTAAHCQDLATRLAFKLAGGDTNLYYRIQTLDAYTPASAQNYFLETSAEVN